VLRPPPELAAFIRHVDYSGVSRVICAGVSPFYVHLVEKHLLKEFANALSFAVVNTLLFDKRWYDAIETRCR
jgi:hypothetical protein